MEQFQHYQMVQ